MMCFQIDDLYIVTFFIANLKYNPNHLKQIDDIVKIF